MIHELPKLWTEKGMAAELGVNTETLRRERKAGRLKFTRIGSGHKGIRYTAAHIAAYLELQECASISKPATASGKSAGPTMLDGPKADRAALEIARRPSSSSTRTA